MHAEYGLTRSSVNLRSQPNLKASIVDVLGPQEQVQIAGEADGMFLVESTRWRPPLQGFTPQGSIIQDAPRPEIFPRIEIADGVTISSVPVSLPLSAFASWLDSGEESPWLPAGYLDAIRQGERPSVGALIRQAINDRRPDWDAWVSEIKGQGRENSCTIDEWIAIVAGGREMWSFRAERLFTQPSQHGSAPAWVMPKDIVHWTGHVRFNDEESKYKLWFEVELTKLDREFKGWYKAGLLDEFVMPTPRTDVSIPQNRDTVFDLAHALLRRPADAEIGAAQRRGRGVAQYIDVGAALGWAKVHHNLCGEFCAAALAGLDVIPLLKQWNSAYPRAHDILEHDLGTSIVDLQSILDLAAKRTEFFRTEASVAPITPAYVRRKLDSGRMAIVGTGVTYNGIIRCGSRVRHWIVVEDILLVGSSGWVRLYNPFVNREEVYPFEAVFGTAPWSTVGLWLEPARPLRSDANTLKGALAPAIHA